MHPVARQNPRARQQTKPYVLASSRALNFTLFRKCTRAVFNAAMIYAAHTFVSAASTTDRFTKYRFSAGRFAVGIAQTRHNLRSHALRLIMNHTHSKCAHGCCCCCHRSASARARRPRQNHAIKFVRAHPVLGARVCFAFAVQRAVRKKCQLNHSIFAPSVN